MKIYTLLDPKTQEKKEGNSSLEKKIMGMHSSGLTVVFQRELNTFLSIIKRIDATAEKIAVHAEEKQICSVHVKNKKIPQNFALILDKIDQFCDQLIHWAEKLDKPHEPSVAVDCMKDLTQRHHTILELWGQDKHRLASPPHTPAPLLSNAQRA